MTVGVLAAIIVALLLLQLAIVALVGALSPQASAPFCERAMEQISADAEPITVTFGKSGKIIAWNPKLDSLLELAEESGIEVETGCRAGSCGSCQTKLVSGEIEYQQQPDAEIEPGHCLLCISTPKNDITLAA